MAKVGYIFKADRYDGLEADKEWMEKYGCVQVIEESVDNEALRPKWKQLVANLERGDENRGGQIQQRSPWVARIVRVHRVVPNQGGAYHIHP